MARNTWSVYFGTRWAHIHRVCLLIHYGQAREADGPPLPADLVRKGRPSSEPGIVADLSYAVRSKTTAANSTAIIVTNKTFGHRLSLSSS